MHKQADVAEWLCRLELDEYIDLFRDEGYEKEDDIENLKDLKQEDFQAMGIHKRGESGQQTLKCSGVSYCPHLSHTTF